MKKRANWTWVHDAVPPRPNVHEREHGAKPVLYDANGTPLISVPRPVGFALPKGSGEPR